VSESKKQKRVVGTEPETDVAQMSPVQPLWDGWSRPNRPSEVLDIGAEYARMEGLWCAGHLFQIRNWEQDRHYVRSPEFVKGEGYPKDKNCFCAKCVAFRSYKHKIETEGLTCSNVKACSVGILIMSALDGPAVNAYFNPDRRKQYYASLDLKALGLKQRPDHVRDEEFIEKLLILDHVGGPACLFLHAGMARLVNERIAAAKAKKAEEPVEQKTEEQIEADWEREPVRPRSPGDPDKMIEEYLVLASGKGPRGGKLTELEVKDRLQRALERHKSEVISWNDGEDDLEDDAIIPLTEGEKRHEAILKGFEYGAEYARRFEGQLGFGADAEPVKV
jgi:hypothetical protein